MTKRVLPTNVALDYDGYVLNDIVQELIDAPELQLSGLHTFQNPKGLRLLSLMLFQIDI